MLDAVDDAPHRQRLPRPERVHVGKPRRNVERDRDGVVAQLVDRSDGERMERRRRGHRLRSP
jgi:hypothetical protein